MRRLSGRIIRFAVMIAFLMALLPTVPIVLAASLFTPDLQGPGGEIVRRPPNPPVQNIKPGRTAASRIKAQVENEIKLANQAREARIQHSVDRIMADIYEEKSSERKYAAQTAEEFRKEAAHYRRALALNSREWRAYYGQGNLYLEQGRYAAAIAAYKKALRYKQDNADVHVALGDASYQQWEGGGSERYSDESARAYEHAVRLGSKDPLVHYRLAHLHFKAGRNRAAVEKYNAYFRLDYQGSPASAFKSEAHYELGLAYLRLGEKQSAMEQYRALKQLGVDQSAEALLKEINKRP